jgi:formylglycine-generating enzyme
MSGSHQREAILLVAAFTAFLTGCAGRGGPRSVGESERRSHIAELRPNVVQVQVSTAGEVRLGFGVIVGEESACNGPGILYIVTANHLIRSGGPPITENEDAQKRSDSQRRRVAVMFYTCRGHGFVPVDLLDFDDEADLAVLAVSAHRCPNVSRMKAGQGRSARSWRIGRVSTKLPEIHQPVWFIGRWAKWELPERGMVNRIDSADSRIIFDTHSVWQGTSGAPLIDADGRIVGVITEDRPGGQGEATAMDLVEIRFEEWGLPFDAFLGCDGPPPKCDPYEGPPGPGQIENRFGMRFVPIEAGCFQMGVSPKPGEGGQYDLPPRRVCLAEDYYIQQTEVTQCQWQAVLGPDDRPFRFTNCGPHCPVESVSWKAVKAFIDKLNQLDSVHTYRLPSEGQWEYACRSGTQSAYPWGEKARCDKMMFANDALAYDGCRKTYAPANRDAVVRVMSFPLEAGRRFELYDMNGNVREWCDDVLKWPVDAPFDAPAQDDEGLRVVRGGGWRSPAAFCRCGARDGLHESVEASSLGFRLVLVPRKGGAVDR